MARQTVLYLVRHGESAGNVNPGMRRSDDPPLTDLGRAQAGRAAAALARRGVEAVFSSPLRRARETAQAIAAAAGAAVQPVDGFGEVDMGALSDSPGEEGRSLREALFASWLAGDRSRSFPGGEDFAAVKRRVRDGLSAVVRAAPGAQVVIVTHRMPIAAAVELCERGAVTSSRACPNASVTTLREEDGRLQLVAFGDARHLD